MPTELDLAYDYCRRVAKEQAKNFYYAFRTLPASRRRAIYAAYAFCRFCDDIADEDIPHSEKVRLFGRTRELLHSGHDGDAVEPVFRALHDARRAFDIPLRYFEEIIEGVEMDLTWTRFRSFDELRSYCYKVASTVGLICIEVFGYSEPRAKEHAVDLGLAMQLTNIIRDVKEDLQRGRIYIPLDEIARFGYSEGELMRGVVNEPFLRLMRHQAERARGYFARGRRLLPLLPARSRPCPAVLHAIYSALLDRIEDEGFRVFDGRITLQTRDKLLLTATTWARSLLPPILLPRP